jgi:HSP20 family protein
MSGRDTVFAELERFFERMSRQFDDASSTWRSQGPLAPWAPSGASVAIDLVDRDEAFVVTADLPGFERDDIDVRITDRTLRIAAERESALDGDADRYLRRERRRESIERAIRLPEAVDRDAVTAETNHGVLTVTLPKLEVRGARHVDVEGA